MYNFTLKNALEKILKDKILKNYEIAIDCRKENKRITYKININYVLTKDVEKYLNVEVREMNILYNMKSIYITIE